MVVQQEEGDVTNNIVAEGSCGHAECWRTGLRQWWGPWGLMAEERTHAGRGNTKSGKRSMMEKWLM